MSDTILALLGFAKMCIRDRRDIAYSIVGEPDKVQFGDRVVGIIEARDGTIMDVVREVKPFSFRED